MRHFGSPGRMDLAEIYKPAAAKAQAIPGSGAAAVLFTVCLFAAAAAVVVFAALVCLIGLAEIAVALKSAVLG